MNDLVRKAPPTPPSRDIHKRDANWYSQVSIACYYLYGRMDMGETRDTNDNYKFAEAWADAKWQFERSLRSSLPTLQGALARWDAKEGI